MKSVQHGKRTFRIVSSRTTTGGDSHSTVVRKNKHVDAAQPSHQQAAVDAISTSRPSPKSTTILDLNNFAILQVLERMDVLSVMAFQTVCLESDNAYYDAFQIYYRRRCQRFDFSFDALRRQTYVTEHHDQLSLLFERIGPYVVELRIRGYLLNCDMHHMNRLLATHCVNLRHLHLRGHRLFDSRNNNVSIAETADGRVSGLVSLKLELLSVANVHIRRYVENNRSTLQTIDFCDVTNFPGSLAESVDSPRLRRVSLSCSDSMQPDGLIRYLVSQPDLEEFELNFSISFGSIEFGEICANLRHLRSLILCASNLGGNIAHIAGLERLERLSLRTYDDINGLLVQLAMRNVLRELRIDGSYGQRDLDSITLSAFVGFTQLNVLSFLSCDFVGTMMLPELGVISGLRELHLIGCDNCGAEQLVEYVRKLDALEVLLVRACRMTLRRSEVRRLQTLCLDRPKLQLRLL